MQPPFTRLTDRPTLHGKVDVCRLFGELLMCDLASSEDRRSPLAGVFAACLQVSSDGRVWRSAGCSCEAAGTFGFRLIQESELQSDSFKSCQIQDEIVVGHRVKIEPVWVNKAARQDWINFCRRHTGAQGCSPSFIYLFFFSSPTLWVQIGLKQSGSNRLGHRGESHPEHRLAVFYF